MTIATDASAIVVSTINPKLIYSCTSSMLCNGSMLHMGSQARNPFCLFCIFRIHWFIWIILFEKFYTFKCLLFSILLAHQFQIFFTLFNSPFPFSVFPYRIESEHTQKKNQNLKINRHHYSVIIIFVDKQLNEIPENVFDVVFWPLKMKSKSTKTENPNAKKLYTK